MSQSVERLKELLFDNETTALQDLSRRVDGLSQSESQARDALQLKIDGIAELDARARDELKKRLDEVYNQAGNTEQLTNSVTQIISEVLRRAEVERHAELSQSLAPLLVSTIKTELRNSQDQMVEALYPITGRLVKAYVASAIQDLTVQMNRRVEQNALMLRLQSLVTGRSVGELALANSNDFAVTELFLIRRGSGALVAHWPDTGGAGRAHAVSGVLAAVNEFANEAFSATESSLRHVDLGSEIVYLRASPIYLLAARCTGQAPEAIAQSVDDALVTAVERQLTIDSTSAPGTDTKAISASELADVGQTLSSAIAEQVNAHRRASSKGAVKFLAAITLIPLAGWFAWSWYGDYVVARTRHAAERVVAADPAMLGYPIGISISGAGKTVTISGLTPSHQAKQRIVSGIKGELPASSVIDEMSVVAGSDLVVPDVKPELENVRREIAATRSEIERNELMRTNKRASNRIDQAVADLRSAVEQKPDGVSPESLTHIADELTAARSEIDAIGNSGALADLTPVYSALTTRLGTSAGGILKAIGAPAASDISTTATDAGPDAALEQFSAQAERVAALASTIVAAKFLRPPPPPAVTIPVPTPPPTKVVAYQPSPREKLEAFARAHAIFFSADLDYRDADASGRWLNDIAKLTQDAKATLRLVGYTDETGASGRNIELAQQRAAKVREELIARGIAADRIITVGRASALDLSDVRGTGTPNRRVEFEIAFEGEVQP
ncbi:MAG: OmpA family protein [Hyphomicrobium sp.]|nr:OmpA family protein [Hyphomicrobium sp.]